MELTELRESIENGWVMVFLCITSLSSADGRLCGAEALSRWQCARFGSVPPGEFIALLEKNGMILSFGRWAFRQAVRQCAVFLDEYPAFSMAVNLSCLQLEDPTLVEYLAQTLREEGVSAEHIIVELTESYLAPNLERLSGLLAQMRGLGLRVAMDDFGTGYSSLSVLKRAPVDIVKIDRSFVQGLCGSAFDHSFVHLMVELCHSVGIRVCVEGVETTAELAALQPFGADYLQGFLLGHPEPAARFSAVVPVSRAKTAAALPFLTHLRALDSKRCAVLAHVAAWIALLRKAARKPLSLARKAALIYLTELHYFSGIRAAYSLIFSKLSALMTCSTRQASSAAVSGETPKRIRQSVNRR